MKKSRLFIVAGVLLCLVCALALTACEEEPEAPAPEAPAHTHTWGEWVTVTPATCTEQGVQTRICACGQSESGYIPALGHLLDGWESDGTHHWQACTRTGCNGVDKALHVYDGENTCTCSHYKDSGVAFTLKNGTYTVTDYTGTASQVIIPSQYKGVAVTSIGASAFYYRSYLTSVTIPASVTSIGDGAFFYCSNLTAVHISDLAAWCNITFGGDYANPLYYASNLYLNGQLVTALEIPNGITAIKDYAFYNCDSLTSVTIPASVTSIGNEAFRDCTGLTSITIPDSVTSIGDWAFLGCTGLTTVEFGANSQLTSIGGYAFRDCSNLTSVTIPASVTGIGEAAFYNCSNLTSITIPAGVTSIGRYAFDSCSNLTSVTFANPNGWWYAASDTATSGAAIPAADLSDASTAATYLKSTYDDYYWKRT